MSRAFAVLDSEGMAGIERVSFFENGSVVIERWNKPFQTLTASASDVAAAHRALDASGVYRFEPGCYARSGLMPLPSDETWMRLSVTKNGVGTELVFGSWHDAPGAITDASKALEDLRSKAQR